jgi:hypothetical protein
VMVSVYKNVSPLKDRMTKQSFYKVISLVDKHQATSYKLSECVNIIILGCIKTVSIKPVMYWPQSTKSELSQGEKK